MTTFQVSEKINFFTGTYAGLTGLTHIRTCIHTHTHTHTTAFFSLRYIIRKYKLTLHVNKFRKDIRVHGAALLPAIPVLLETLPASVPQYGKSGVSRCFRHAQKKAVVLRWLQSGLQMDVLQLSFAFCRTAVEDTHALLCLRGSLRVRTGECEVRAWSCFSWLHG